MINSPLSFTLELHPIIKIRNNLTAYPFQITA
jgi:hypothetical protein